MKVIEVKLTELERRQRAWHDLFNQVSEERKRRNAVILPCDDCGIVLPVMHYAGDLEGSAFYCMDCAAKPYIYPVDFRAPTLSLRIESNYAHVFEG